MLSVPLLVPVSDTRSSAGDVRLSQPGTRQLPRLLVPLPTQSSSIAPREGLWNKFLVQLYHNFNTLCEILGDHIPVSPFSFPACFRIYLFILPFCCHVTELKRLIKND